MKREWMPQYILGAWLAVSSVCFADGVILNGTSARSIGRGGTNIASADTAGLILDNPAGAVNIDSEKLFEVGANLMFTDFSYADPLRSGRSSEFTPLPEVGFIRKTADGNWAYGLGVFAPMILFQLGAQSPRSRRGVSMSARPSSFMTSSSRSAPTEGRCS
jgi:long-subunit fatty acid transport protein